MTVNLVIMAAGLGSRFGGDKQLVDVGPDGEAFFDFAIRDACAAGAGRVVIIVRSEIEQQVVEHAAAIHRGLDVEIATVCQDHHGPSRSKPWGTAHAILSAAEAVDGPFVVVNADDYYGTSSYQQVVGFLEGAGPKQAALVGFALANTLPAMGAVSRGVCETNAAGELLLITETHGLGRDEAGAIVSDDPAGTHADDTLVSMNMWGLPHRFFDHLGPMFDDFLALHGTEEKSEFLLPTVVSDLMNAGELVVDVLPSSEQWIGVTNPDDLNVARAVLGQRGA